MPVVPGADSAPGTCEWIRTHTKGTHMRKMTERQWRAFATYGTRTGKLSTARADSSPHVTPVVDEDRPPYAFVLLQGRATIAEDPDDMLRWGGLLGARYMGDDRTEEYAARNGGHGNLLVRGRIDKVIAFAGIAE